LPQQQVNHVNNPKHVSVKSGEPDKDNKSKAANRRYAFGCSRRYAFGCSDAGLTQVCARGDAF
jgi:hypothetical protein